MVIQEEPFGNLRIGIGIDFGVAKNHFGIKDFVLKNSTFMFFLLLSHSIYYK